jgi:hypothetical protein
MFKFLPGILLIQAATITLVLLAPEELQGMGWLRLIVPILFISFVSAFWFYSMAEHRSKDHIAKVSNQFAKEREALKVNAERAKTRVVKQAQKDIAKEARITHAKANFKVGAAFAGALGAGALMLLTEFMTLGLLTMTTAGGALGGYLLRAKKEYSNKGVLPAPEKKIKVIQAKRVNKREK